MTDPATDVTTPGTMVEIDEHGHVEVRNMTDIPTSDVMRSLEAANGPVFRALTAWSQGTQGGFGLANGRQGSLFERDRYVTPTKIFDQMKLAYQAVEQDDVVAGVAESTESLAFNKVTFYAEDKDEEDVYNQIAADIDLDSRLREMWRELFITSQVVVGIWWHTKTYKPRTTTEGGKKKKKTFTVRCPKALTMLDPLKVFPMGNLMFNQEDLCYITDREEGARFEEILKNRDGSDQIVERLMLGRYFQDREPTTAERKLLADHDIDPRNLWLLNPVNVFRHTATRPQFHRFSPVRMKSVFELLDMKHQLRQMDRAHLIGATNFIVLITKGSDQHPAHASEIANLQTQVRSVARVPILVGDHRLSVEIVTPKTDMTLKAERYNALDSRITGRLFQMFVLGNYSAGTSGDDTVKLVKMIARGMEGRRHMMRRSLEQKLWGPMFDANDNMETEPKLRFAPRSIALDFDAAFASFLLQLREANEISRETILSMFDLDQGEEAMFLEREAEDFDETFQTQVPFAAPNPKNRPAEGEPGAPTQTTKQGGRNGGGNRNGGGAAPGTGQGKAPVRPNRRSDRGRTRPASADNDFETDDDITGLETGDTDG